MWLDFLIYYCICSLYFKLIQNLQIWITICLGLGFHPSHGWKMFCKILRKWILVIIQMGLIFRRSTLYFLVSQCCVWIYWWYSNNVLWNWSISVCICICYQNNVCFRVSNLEFFPLFVDEVLLCINLGGSNEG